MVYIWTPLMVVTVGVDLLLKELDLVVNEPVVFVNCSLKTELFGRVLHEVENIHFHLLNYPSQFQ